jgi:hypothetical protein
VRALQCYVLLTQGHAFFHGTQCLLQIRLPQWMNRLQGVAIRARNLRFTKPFSQTNSRIACPNVRVDVKLIASPLHTCFAVYGPGGTLCRVTPWNPGSCMGWARKREEGVQEEGRDRRCKSSLRQWSGRIPHSTGSGTHPTLARPRYSDSDFSSLMVNTLLVACGRGRENSRSMKCYAMQSVVCP